MQNNSKLVLSNASAFTTEQSDYLRKLLVIDLPQIMSALLPIIQKESVVAGDVNAHEVKSGGGNARTNDAANIDALQSKIDLERTLIKWDLLVARNKMQTITLSNGTILETVPVGRPAFRDAVRVAANVAEHIDWLGRHSFHGENGVDFAEQVIARIDACRNLLGVHGSESDEEAPRVFIPRNAAQIARDSGLDKPMRGKEIVRVMRKNGYEDMTPERLWKWASRKHIVAVGYDGRFPQYLVSDVLDIYNREGRKIEKKDVAA